MTKLSATLSAMQESQRTMRSLVDRARQIREAPATNVGAGEAIDGAIDRIADAVASISMALKDAMGAATQLADRPRRSGAGTTPTKEKRTGPKPRA